jgi:hypothetical protein
MGWKRMAIIDPILDKYYQNRFSMMATDGWLDLIDDVKKMLDSTNTIEGIDSEKQLMFRKGEISIMRWLLSLREVSETAYKELKNEDD